jgi:poly(3-hydroxybutyrate) depolymerase
MTDPRFRLVGLAALGLVLSAFLVPTPAARDDKGKPAAPAAGPAIPRGLGDFEFADPKGDPKKPVRVWTYRPERFGPDSPVVFVLHGTFRNGETYRQPWVPIADEHGCLVVCPEFSQEHYASTYSYHFGNVITPDGKPVEEARWTFTTVENLFDEVRARAGAKAERYHAFGHSAGGQFLHRMVLMKPDARIALAVAANSGSYTMPDPGVKFPYGLGGLDYPDDRLKKALAAPLVVLLGEKDTDPKDQYLPRGREAMAQGPHRLARGKGFMEQAGKAADRVGVKLGWRSETVPDVGHDNALMAPAAARLMFGPRPAPAGKK